MTSKKIETLVGMFVLAGIVAFLFLSLKAANLGAFNGGRQGYMVTARFDNIGGLKVRAPVRSAGVVVGRVKSIKFDSKTYQGVVYLEIEEDVKFPKDSSAKILTSGLLGDQYIGLEPGAEEVELKDGDSVELTQSAIVLESLISQFLFSGSKSSSSSATSGGAPAAPAAAASGAQP
jgi:phospholipid/cholesterol/gamma-HCH transport system substrate-binding protein